MDTVHPSTLKRWFKNKALIGEWRDTKPFTPIIDKETFYKLQHEITKRAKDMSPEQTYDISGIVVCEKCGSRYYYRRKENNGSTIIYGNCSTYLKRGEPYCDNNKSMPYEVLLFAYKKTNLSHTLRAATAHSNHKLAEKIEALKAERDELSKRIRNITIALESIPNQPELIERIAELDQKRNELKREIYDLESGTKDLPEKYTTGDFFKLLNTENEQSDEILMKREELLKDPIMLREALKKIDYKIYADGAKIKAQDGTLFELIKRSQKHKCYIVKCTHKEEAELITWAAISRSTPPLGKC